MAYLHRQRVLAAKVESEKGTAETLTAAEAKILAEDIRFEFAPEELQRNVLSSTLSRFSSISGAPIATVTCRVELRGSGTATTAPSYGTLLRACGFVESVNTSNVTYTVESDDASTDTVTLGVYIGSGATAQIRKLYAARGDVSFELTANQIPVAAFTFTGIYSSASTGSQLSPTYESTTPDRWYNASIEIGSWTSPVVESMTIAMNNTVVLRNNADSATGLEYAIISDRDPGGTIDPEIVALATYNPYTKTTAETLEALAFTVGSGAGNTLTFSAPKAQIISVPDGDRNSICTWPLNFKLRRNAGDDELVITHS